MVSAPMSEELARLAAAYGVATSYWGQAGNYVEVPTETVEAVLRALGVDPSTPESIGAALEDLRLRVWRRTLPPVFVVREGESPWCWVHLPDGTGAEVHVALEGGAGTVPMEQVDHWVEPQWVDGRLVGEATFRVPGDLPLGWHRIVARTEDGEASSPLVVAPRRLAPAALERGRLWGFMTQAYSMRSARSWGLGDLCDLADLAAWSGYELGAGYVLVNPLHAAAPVPPVSPSPYLPATRRFTDPIYLRIEDVPEFGYLDADERAEVDALAEPVRALSTSAELLDRDSVWAAKRAALEIIRRVPLTPGRRAALDAFRAREGVGLEAFATWCALAEEHGTVWQDWPEGLRDPRSAAVAAEQVRLRDRIDFYAWLQFLVDEQLSWTQTAARSSGMRAGIVHDLAVGVHPEGADAWALQSVLATGVSVGAPPDMYNQMGQNWSQPPWRPDALADAAFVPYRDMLRTILRHAGGIRIDHVLGLFRLYWIPEGMPAYAGTYVTYDHDALVGILTLEAHRAGAFVVGEDLGTVEPWVQEFLLDRGVLGTTVLWFEREDDGAIRWPDRWRPSTLASVTVHDLPPTAGYLAGEHVRIRGELGLLAHSVEEEAADHEREMGEWDRVLRGLGALAEGDTSLEGRIVALHRALGRSPSVLLGVSLPDAVGDRRAQNQPGTDQEYPNWRIPLCDGDGRPVLVEDLPSQPLLRRLVDALGE